MRQDVVCIALALSFLYAFQGDVFSVQSITPMGAGRYDVKLRNPRTGYVHSVTLPCGSMMGIAVGDTVSQTGSGRDITLTRAGGGAGATGGDVFSSNSGGSDPRNPPCGDVFQSGDSWKRNPSGPCNLPPLTSPPSLITNLQQLANTIFGRYNTGQPIGVARITNLPYSACLVVIQGTQFAGNQSTGPLEDVAAAHGWPDYFRTRVFQALADQQSRGVCPRGSAVILAGHSLGGMEAQLVASDPRLAQMGLWPKSVITFGSPKVADEVATPTRDRTGTYVTDYRRFTAIGDPIPLSTKGAFAYRPTKQTFVDDRSYADQQKAIGFYADPQNSGALWMGAVGAHMWYPCINALRGYDAMGTRMVPGLHNSTLRLDVSTWHTYSASSAPVSWYFGR
jgi:hypothetical protein